MIKNYSLFYSYKTLGDVLLVNIDDTLLSNREVKKNNILALYHDDLLVGINIFDISKIMKIKSQGMIYLPSNSLIDVINSLLENAGLETLAYKTESGYVIGEIKRVDDKEMEIDIKKDIYLLPSHKEVHQGDKVVLAKIGTYLNNGRIVKNVPHLCSYEDLGIENKKDILIIEEETEKGLDFFMMEEH